MEQRTLKMVAWTCGGDNAFGTMNYEDIDEKEMDDNSWWYLHGKLEEMAGYDKATCINCREIGISFPTINWTGINGSEVIEIREDEPEINRMHFTGVIDVDINGLDEPCVGFFWVTDEKIVQYKDRLYPLWKQRGLVCLKSDKKAIEYAQKKWVEKTWNL